jgi:hypothetical protein
MKFTSGLELLEALDEKGLLTTALTVEMAVVCAEHVFGSVPKEKKKSCRKAIKAAEGWLADPSKKNRLEAKKTASFTLQDTNVPAAWGACHAARAAAALVYNHDPYTRASAFETARKYGDDPETEGKWQARKIIKIFEKKGIDIVRMMLNFPNDLELENDTRENVMFVRRHKGRYVGSNGEDLAITGGKPCRQSMAD